MENSNDLKLLLTFVPSFKEKSVLQLGSSLEYTQLFTKEGECASKVVVVDSNESLLNENRKAHNTKNVEFIKNEFKSLNLNGQK
jgi:hypothetical protein